MPKRSFVPAAALLSLAILGPPAVANGLGHGPPAAVSCGDLASDPRHGLAGNPAVKSVQSQVIAASGANVAYCQVNLLFGTTPDQNINIRVGLPLNATDGGSGGVQGAWNGRTQGVGGGGCAGNLRSTAVPGAPTTRRAFAAAATSRPRAPCAPTS